MAEAHLKQIEVYLTADGKAPFSEWLDALKNREARAAIRVRLDRVRLGNMGDCKRLEAGVSELRIDFGPGYRVYFGQVRSAPDPAALWGREEHPEGRHEESPKVLGRIPEDSTWQNGQKAIKTR